MTKTKSLPMMWGKKKKSNLIRDNPNEILDRKCACCWRFTANITTAETVSQRQHTQGAPEASPLLSPHKRPAGRAQCPPSSRVVTSTRNLLRLKTKVSKFSNINNTTSTKRRIDEKIHNQRSFSLSTTRFL